MVEKTFAGDFLAQKTYFAALGRWNYEQMANVTGGLGLSVRLATRYPGKPTDFLESYWQRSFYDLDVDLEVDFMRALRP